MRRLALPILLAASAASGQVRVEGKCAAEIVEKLDLPCTPDQPCPLVLELANVTAVAERVILTGNLHTGSETVESVLLVSEDGGRTWNEGHARIPGAVLDQIQFADYETGWINGHLLAPSARDPFFLLTTDGGKTWRRRPIYGETRSGAIEQFWFDSKTHGTMTIDRVRNTEGGLRYELYESMTGGDSWNIRQADSNPLTFPRPAPAPPVWRIGANARTKMHRLERQMDGKWVPVAEFSVAAGVCKPPEPTPAAEPAPPPEQPPVPADPPPPGPKKPPTLRRK